MPEEITPPEPDDSGVWDHERGMNTITKMRAVEKANRLRIHALEAGVRELSRGLPADPALLGDEPDSEVANLKSAFTDISAVLGVEFSGDPAPLLAAARAAAIAGPLARATQTAGVDHDLTVALLSQGGALAALDLSADVGAQLAEAVESVKVDHPNVRLQTQTATRSGMEIPAGSGGAPAAISRESLKFLDAETITKLQKSGQLEGIGVGGDGRTG